MKDELRGKIMTEFLVQRLKSYIYMTYNENEENEEAKDTKKCFVKNT